MNRIVVFVGMILLTLLSMIFGYTQRVEAEKTKAELKILEAQVEAQRIASENDILECEKILESNNIQLHAALTELDRVKSSKR